jgi:hypothetical protein
MGRRAKNPAAAAALEAALNNRPEVKSMGAGYTGAQVSALTWAFVRRQGLEPRTR